MSLFQTHSRSGSPIRSENGDEPSGSGARNETVHRAGEVTGVFGVGADKPRGVFKADAKAASLKGRTPIGHDPRKFRYDVTRGRGKNLGFETTRDDRMSAVEAGAMLHRIHELEGLAAETEGVLCAFDKALFFCHTVNGGSVLSPGRATFYVPGVSKEFSYENIRDILGVHQRRFFRAFADEIAEVNLEVIRDYDPYDPVSSEKWGWLMQVAYERGLNRYPQFSHDSADACIKMSPTERAAVAASKVLVISTSNNSADRFKANNRVASADNYDSTVGASN